MNVAAGIISLILAIIVLFQSCSVAALGRMSEMLSENTVEYSPLTMGGFAGFWVALMLLFSGAFAFKIPKVAQIFSYIAAIIAISIANATPYKDMYIWGGIAFFLGVLNTAGARKKRKQTSLSEEAKESENKSAE